MCVHACVSLCCIDGKGIVVYHLFPYLRGHSMKNSLFPCMCTHILSSRLPSSPPVLKKVIVIPLEEVASQSVAHICAPSLKPLSTYNSYHKVLTEWRLNCSAAAVKCTLHGSVLFTHTHTLSILVYFLPGYSTVSVGCLTLTSMLMWDREHN